MSNYNIDPNDRPNPEEYHERDGDLEQFSKDYDEWEANQS